ncbi:zinc finger BED domain-containing protein 4-like [Dermacentor albipictus]|uniref:zinc finger BED domain-containing protein 4-like n=1 Tax=Dermacentor albipictus TaxID=60249 RepID=UPI0038FD15A4
MNESAQRVFRSAIWEFFDRGASDATCRTCKMRLKTPTGTTTTLVNHLKRHPDPFKQFEKLRAAESSKKLAGPKKTTGTNKADASAASCSYFKPTLKGDSQRAKTLTKVAQFLATGLHSYSIVEEPGFLSLMHTAVPEYKVPSRTTFSRSVVPELYAKEKERIKSELRHHFADGTPCYSVTTDGWTSRPGDSYVSFTCHLVDKEFRLHNYHLACRHMPEGHTSDNLKRILLDLAKEWGLPQDVPVFIVTDNARNFLGAASRTGWTSIQCFAHTLQLCIQCAKKDTQNFEQLCVKARAIVGHYKRSSQARSRLKEVQVSMGLEPLEVIQDVATRWNIEYEMMSRLLKLRVPISLNLSEQDTLENLTSSEWHLMASITSVLKCVDDATRESCSEKHPTLSQVVPLVHCMQLLLTQQQQRCGEESAFAGNLLHSMKSRFVDIKLQVTYALSTALDPRFKAVCYDTTSEKRWLKNLLCSAVEKSLPQERDSEEPSAPAQAVSSDVWDVFGALASTTTSSTGSQRLMEEVEEYLHAPVRPRLENPFLWWKNFGEDKYPSLSKLARLYLSVPATQVSCERLFSSTGNVVTTRREHLLPDHVEQLVFIHSNMH